MMNVITWSCIDGERLNHTGNSAAKSSIILILVELALFLRTPGRIQITKDGNKLISSWFLSEMTMWFCQGIFKVSLSINFYNDLITIFKNYWPGVVNRFSAIFLKLLRKILKNIFQNFWTDQKIFFNIYELLTKKYFSSINRAILISSLGEWF